MAFRRGRLRQNRVRLPWSTRSQLKDQIADLEASIERMDKLSTVVSLIKAGQDPSDHKAFLIDLHSDVWPAIAHCLATWFFENGGKNYIEQQVGIPDPDQKSSISFSAGSYWNRDRTEIEPKYEEFVITMQRKGGETPTQQLAQAKALLDQKTQELTEAQAAFKEMHDAVCEWDKKVDEAEQRLPKTCPNCDAEVFCDVCYGRPLFDPTVGQERDCDCGHPYYRHFDSYDNNRPVGCKYCGCPTFQALAASSRETP